MIGHTALRSRLRDTLAEMRVAAMVCALGGCSLVFPLEEPPIDAPPDAPLIDPACRTKATAIRDDFADGVIGPLWTKSNSPGGVVSEGQDSIIFDITQIGTDAILTGVPYVDLLDSEISIDVTHGTFVDGAYIALQLYSVDYNVAGTATGHMIELRLTSDGTKELLIASHYVGGAENRLRTLDFDAATMTTWRLARVGDSTVWSVGASYDTLGPIADFPLDFVRFMQPVVFAHDFGADVHARASKFNTRATATEVCAAETLIDDFETGLDELGQWGRRTDQTCRFDLVNGALQLDDNPGGQGFSCSLGASGLYNLIDHSITIAADISLLAGSEDAYFSLTTLTQTKASFQVFDGMLRAVTLDNGVNTPNQIPYVPASARYWKLAGVSNDHGGVDLVWSTSGNGVDYAFFAKVTDFAGLDRVVFDVGVDAYSGLGSMVRFDHVNVAP